MNLDRFEQLAWAFGADVGRWPLADREAARRLVAAQPTSAGALLAQAARLDRILSTAGALPSPSRTLRERIILAAPSVRSSSLAWRWLAGAAIGATMAAACAAGVATGVTVGAPALARVQLAMSADTGDDAIRLLREPPDLAEG